MHPVWPPQAFPTAQTHPGYGWQRLPQLPSVIWAVVPAVGGARHLYVYSERTGETYEKRCQRPGMAPIHAAVLDFARQHG